MPRPFFDHFRFVAPVYDHVFGAGGSAPDLAEPLALPTPGYLLDVGGGTGRVAQAFSAQTGGAVIVDVSLEMLRLTGRHDGLRPAVGQVERLPFASGQFDRLLIVDAFHHFFEYDTAVRELWRVLAPGGRIVLLEPDITRWPVKLIALAETLLLMRSHFFRAEQLHAMFAALPGAHVEVSTDAIEMHIQLIAEKAAP
jgi:ubiquinone/menaquinone biosynthesis C-methylase UbiE